MKIKFFFTAIRGVCGCPFYFLKKNIIFVLFHFIISYYGPGLIPGYFPMKKTIKIILLNIMSILTLIFLLSLEENTFKINYWSITTKLHLQAYTVFVITISFLYCIISDE